METVLPPESGNALPDQVESSSVSSPEAAQMDYTNDVVSVNDVKQLQSAPADLVELKTAHKYTYYGPTYSVPFSTYCFTSVFNSESCVCFRIGTVFALPQREGLWVLGAITGRNANNPSASAVCGIFCSLESDESATANISWLSLKHIRRFATNEEKKRTEFMLGQLDRVPKPVRATAPRSKAMHFADAKMTVFRAKARVTGAQAVKRPRKKSKTNLTLWKPKQRTANGGAGTHTSDDEDSVEASLSEEEDDNTSEAEYELASAATSASASVPVHSHKRQRDVPATAAEYYARTFNPLGPTYSEEFFNQNQHSPQSETGSEEAFETMLQQQHHRNNNAYNKKLRDYEDLRFHLPSLDSEQQDLLIQKVQEYFAVKERLSISIEQK